MSVETVESSSRAGTIDFTLPPDLQELVERVRACGDLAQRAVDGMMVHLEGVGELVAAGLHG